MKKIVLITTVAMLLCVILLQQQPISPANAKGVMTSSSSSKSSLRKQNCEDAKNATYTQYPPSGAFKTREIGGDTTYQFTSWSLDPVRWVTYVKKYDNLTYTVNYSYSYSQDPRTAAPGTTIFIKKLGTTDPVDPNNPPRSEYWVLVQPGVDPLDPVKRVTPNEEYLSCP